MLRYIALLVLVFILMSPGASALGAEPGSGIVEGAVMNGTENGTSVANLDVTLQIYQDDTKMGATATSTDALGQFVFDGLATESGYRYQAVVIFQGVDYSSIWLSFKEGEAAKSAKVMVYDTTTSDEALRVEVLRTSIYLEQDSLRVSEFLFFVNNSDRTYIGSGEETASGMRETLRFFLPHEAGELQTEIGLTESYVYRNEDGFSDTMPVLPGMREITYSYKIDFDTEAYEFPKKVYYPITTYNFLVEDKGIEITTDQLVAEEPIFMKDTWFKLLSGQDFVPGDTIAIQLLKVPQPIQWAVIVIWVALGLMVLTAVLIFVYWMKKGRVKPVKPEHKLPAERA